MIDLKQTETFRKWRAKLKDERGRAAIALRLARLAYGHAGDAEPVGQGTSKLHIHYGPRLSRLFSKARPYDYRSALRWRQNDLGKGH